MRLRNDLTGKRYGRLLAVKPIPRKGKNTKYLCRCDCGAECEVIGSELVRERTTSCGCYHNELTGLQSTVNMIKKKIGRLTVIARAGSTGRLATWKCQCECGNVITVTGNNLRTENTLSCGCYKLECNREHAERLNDGSYDTPRNIDVAIDDVIGRVSNLFK